MRAERTLEIINLNIWSKRFASPYESFQRISTFSFRFWGKSIFFFAFVIGKWPEGHESLATSVSRGTMNDAHHEGSMVTLVSKNSHDWERTFSLTLTHRAISVLVFSRAAGEAKRTLRLHELERRNLSRQSSKFGDSPKITKSKSKRALRTSEREMENERVLREVEEWVEKQRNSLLPHALVDLLPTFPFHMVQFLTPVDPSNALSSLTKKSSGNDSQQTTKNCQSQPSFFLLTPFFKCSCFCHRNPYDFSLVYEKLEL